MADYETPKEETVKDDHPRPKADDEDEPEVKKSKVALTNVQGESYFTLAGSKRRVTVRSFKSMTLVDVREVRRQSVLTIAF